MQCSHSQASFLMEKCLFGILLQNVICRSVASRRRHLTSLRRNCDPVLAVSLFSLHFDILVDRDSVKIFDILFLNGVSLIAKTLHIRKGLLRKHVSEIHGRIEYVQEFSGKTSKDVRMRMDEIIENKLVNSTLRGLY